MNHTPEQVRELRERINLDEVRKARQIVSRHLPRTPLIRHPVLADEIGLDLYVKHENHLPTGAFKIRGGFNYIANLSPEKKRRGVIAATRGNHGQSIAFASKTYDVPCTILVPLGNNPEKNAAMRAYGANLIEHGNDYDEARVFAEDLAEREGLAWITAGSDPELLNGVGTYSLEIFEDLPELDAIIVPIGAGSGICGAITVLRALKPGVRIIGVQAEGAPAVYNSWRAKRPIPHDRAQTIADGVATRVPFDLPFAIMCDGVDDMVLISEDEISNAIRLLLRTTHNLAEGAGAASTAAAIKLRAQLKNLKVVAVLSGGNIDTQTLQRVLNTD